MFLSFAPLFNQEPSNIHTPWLYLKSVIPIGALYFLSLCSSLAFLLVEPVTMSRDLYLSSVVPIGAILLIRVSLCSLSLSSLSAADRIRSVKCLLIDL